MNIFFTSDEHHGHENIIKFCNRPFPNVTEMTEGLIERHNSVVKDGDVVHHVGDMFWRRFGAQNAIDTMNRLNGKHVYVLGNHEELIENYRALQNRFFMIRDRLYIKPDGGPRAGIVLDHYAGRVWEGSHQGSWQFYGHTHNELVEDPYLLSCDVGVDAWNYYPVSLEQLKFKMEAKRPAFEAKREMLEQMRRERK